MTLRVHHLMSTFHGGAGGAARRIIDAQRDFGIATQVFTGDDGPAPFPGWERLAWPRRSWTRHLWRHRMSLAKRTRPRSFEIMTPAVWGGVTPLPRHVTDCDALHLHWMGGRWVDFPSFAASIPAGLPVVWTLHDLNALLPLSHYFDDPGRLVADPSVENRWINPLGRGLVAASWRARLAFARQCRVTFAPVARWQLAVLQNSPVAQAADGWTLIRYPFAFDPAASPMPRDAARRRLGLEPAARYVLLGAESLANPRKGFRHAFDALHRGVGVGKDAAVRVITFGHDNPTGRDAALIDRSFGFVADRDRLGTLYAAADVFVTPALQESCSQTGLEALAAGTPVVCFDGTGSTEYVVDGVNGAAAPHPTTESLREAMAGVLSRPEHFAQARVWRHFAKTVWPERFHPQTAATLHAELYASLRDRPAGRAAASAAVLGR